MNGTREKHTPGPWGFHPADWSQIVANHRFDAAGDDRYSLVAEAGDDSGLEYGTMAANARLIAAAPDLLKMLKEAVSHDNALKAEWKVPPRLLADMQKAIARAEGE